MFERYAKRTEIGVPIDAFMLTSVGELNTNKNHSVVVRALSKTDMNIHFVIAGKGEMENMLRRLAEENRVSDRVHLLGFRSDIPELYRASDCCVFPSIREGLGLAGVEGMASGLPMIVADNRGTRSFVESENGIVCKYDDVDAFARAVTYLFKERNICEEMKDRNVKRSKSFDTAVVDTIMSGVYKQA